MKYHPELPVEDYTLRHPKNDTAKNPFSKENIQPSTPSDTFVHILLSSGGFHSRGWGTGHLPTSTQQ